MIIYNLLFLIPLSFWFLNKRNNKLENFYFLFMFLYYLIILGLRYNIGNDWHSYQYAFFNYYNPEIHYSVMTANYFFDFISNPNLYSGSFEAYNLITSLIFLLGIFIFSYHQQDKIFAIALCYPYLILFVGMGYIRQSLSISLFLIAITLIYKKKSFFGIFFILLSLLTHKMIIIPCLILLLSIKFINYKSIIKLSFVFIPLVFILFFFTGYAEYMVKFYMTEATYFTSQGVSGRIILSIFPALLLFYKRDVSYIFNKFESRFFKYSSYFIIVLIPASIFFSTATDRMLIFTSLSYVYIYAFSNVNFYTSNTLKIFLQPAILMLLIIYLNIWLLFSDYRSFWLPYENLIMRIF